MLQRKNTYGYGRNKTIERHLTLNSEWHSQGSDRATNNVTGPFLTKQRRVWGTRQRPEKREARSEK